MGLGAFIQAVVAGPRRVAQAIPDAGASLQLDDHQLEAMIEAFTTHPKAPEVYLDWLRHTVDAETMGRCNVDRATPAAVALKAIRRMHSTVKKGKGGFRDAYELWFTGTNGRDCQFWPAQVEFDGRSSRLRFGWDECVAIADPQRKGDRPIDLRKKEPFHVVYNNQHLLLRVVRKTYAQTYLKELEALLRLCEIAAERKGFVLIGLA